MFIRPFKGRNSSNAYNLNFLFNEEKLYIMDNHLAAIWCWLKKVDTQSVYNLLHIDRHYDLLNSQCDAWVNKLRSENIDLSNISIDDFTSLKYRTNDSPIDMDYTLFRWDNYLPILYRLHLKLMAMSYFATHKNGDTIDGLDIIEVDSWTLQDNLSYWINERSKLKWIVNLDIDYFFTSYNDEYYQLFTDEYVMRLADEIKASWENIEVLTIALSPEMCGSWEEAERVGRLFTRTLGFNWPL